MSVRTSTRSVKISTLEISDNADDAWRVQRTSDGAITARKVGGVDEPVWVSADLAEFRSDVRVAGDAAIPSRLVLPQDGASAGEVDYATAQSSCLVPKSVVDDLTRRPAFVLGTSHASVTDTRYTVSPAADNKLMWEGGKWGPYNVNLSNPTGQIVFRVPLSGGDVYAAPVFRTAHIGAPAWTTGAVVENAFPSATTLAVTGAHVSLHNLQLSSEGGGTCKIQVSLRILDVAVDTGRYENEVFRELDLTQPDEFVNTFGLYADGRWIWKNSRTLTKRVDVGISAAVRVQIKVALTEFGAQTDPLTYATIRLDTTPATFATDAFAGSVSAPTVVGRTLSVTHGITQTAGSNMGVACRVYTSRKNAATAEELYTKSGTAGSDLVASGAFPITGTAGAVGTGPLSFSELADGTYYVYVVAKGSSGTFSYSHERIVPLDATPPTVTLPVLWFDFSDTSSMTVERNGSGSVSDGSLVGTVRSKSSANTLIAISDAARPSFAAAQKNGLGTATFVAANAHAMVQQEVLTYTKYTLAYITRRNAFVSNGRTYSSCVTGGATYGSHRRNTSNNFDSYSNTPVPNLMMYPDSAPWSDYRLVVERFTASQKKLWSNGVAGNQSSGTPPNATNTRININCVNGTSLTYFDNQNMAEFLFFNADLSDSDISALSSALMTRWNVV
eukprot:jgi/Mesvir1/20265/Mv13498-RA.1